MWKIVVVVVFVGSCGVGAGVLIVVGHLKHWRIAVIVLLYLLCGLATSVIFVAAPEVVSV
jgi:hypothetical protein